MTEKEHLECIAEICGNIENNLKHIRGQVDALETLYGIRIAETGIQTGLNVHVIAGLELLERALDVKAREERDGCFCQRVFHTQRAEWHQLARKYKAEYREANEKGDALYDLRTGRDKA